MKRLGRLSLAQQVMLIVALGLVLAQSLNFGLQLRERRGFGITWVEAGAYGVPVVGYRVDGLDTVTDACSIMVAPGDRRALAAGLRDVLLDADRRQSLSEAARANAQRFDPLRASREFFQVIEQEMKRVRG